MFLLSSFHDAGLVFPRAIPTRGLAPRRLLGGLAGDARPSLPRPPSSGPPPLQPLPWRSWRTGRACRAACSTCSPATPPPLGTPWSRARRWAGIEPCWASVGRVEDVDVFFLCSRRSTCTCWLRPCCHAASRAFPAGMLSCPASNRLLCKLRPAGILACTSPGQLPRYLLRQPASLCTRANLLPPAADGLPPAVALSQNTRRASPCQPPAAGPQDRVYRQHGGGQAADGGGGGDGEARQPGAGRQCALHRV